MKELPKVSRYLIHLLKIKSKKLRPILFLFSSWFVLTLHFVVVRNSEISGARPGYLALLLLITDGAVRLKSKSITQKLEETQCFVLFCTKY